MNGKSELREGRAEDIARLTRDPERAPLVLFALARPEAELLTDQLGTFLSITSTLTSLISQVEALISTAEERAQRGLSQRLKALLGASTREQCLAEAYSLLDPMRLHMDSLALLARDVRESIQDLQTWVEALQDATPTLPKGIQDSARERTVDLKTMIANGENAFSPYEGLTRKSEMLRAWALRAQRSMGE